MQTAEKRRLNCHRFRSNEVPRRLTVIPCNLWRRVMPPRRFANWPLTRLYQRLVKGDSQMATHAFRYWLLLAVSHLTRRLFAVMLGRILLQPVPTPKTSGGY